MEEKLHLPMRFGGPGGFLLILLRERALTEGMRSWHREVAAAAVGNEDGTAADETEGRGG